jgi:hypothetical protein
MTSKDWKPDHVFVFGSNLRGSHGAGAAKFAHENCGAEYGKGIGRSGMSYAIPTKDYNIQTLPLHRISAYVDYFIQYAEEHGDENFQLTPIGCGLARYTPEQIAPMFKDAPSNVVLPPEFLEVLKNDTN